MKNKIVFITGATSGIGEGCARKFAAMGSDLILNGRNIEKLNVLKTELTAQGADVLTLPFDVRDRSAMRSAVESLNGKWRNIDVLINNAGIAEEKLFTDITEEDFDKMMKVNLYSVFYTTQEVVKNMLKLHNGIIINISSIYGLTGGSCEVHYSMAKAGIDGMTKALAKELGPSNIRINSIAPGAIDTDMNKNLTEEDWKVVEEETPLNKRGKPIDITRCVKWLIEDEFTTPRM